MSAPWLRVSPSVGHRRDALPGARLTDDPERLPDFDGVRDAVDGMHDPILGREPDLEVLDLEERFAHEYRTLGSRYAYAISTTRLKKTMKNAPNSVMPWITVRSDTLMAL